MAPDEIKLPQGTLTNDEVDTLSGMMIVFMHAAERCLQLCENHYEAEYRAGKEYMYLRKRYGKIAADEILHKQVKRVIRGDERNKLGKILEAADRFHKAMESLSGRAIALHVDEVNDMEAFDHLLHDVNFLCYAYALMANCKEDKDELRIISSLKIMAKGDSVSDNLLNILKERVQL